MKKFSALLLALLLWVFTVPAYADLQFSNNGTRAGQFRKVNLPAGMSIADNGDITFSAPALGAATFTTLVGTGSVKFNTSLFADGDSETSSVLFSSSTCLGASNMPYSDVYKTIGGSADQTALHDGVGNGQICRFHVMNPAIPSGGSWVLTADHSMNINSFTMSTARSELSLIFVNSTFGWQPMGACNAVTIAYKAAQV